MVGLMIIAHAPLASSLRDVARHVYPDCAGRLEALDEFLDRQPDNAALAGRSTK